MDFTFTPEEEAFGQQVSGFLKKELPADLVEVGDRQVETDEGRAFYKAMARKPADKGWLVMHWSREYGEQNASRTKQFVFTAEAACCSCPGIEGFGTKMLGPILIAHNTEGQRQLHLSYIARGEVRR